MVGVVEIEVEVEVAGLIRVIKEKKIIFDEYTIKFVVEDFPYEVTKENVDKCLSCFKHLIGLLSMTFFLLKRNVKFR